MSQAQVGVVGHTQFYASSALGNNNAGFHNSIFRGKNLGAFNATHQAAIAAGTFDDIFNGDFWQSSFVRRNQDGSAIDTITVNWRIHGFNVKKNKGSTAVSANSALVWPDQCLGKIRMNATDTTAGGYAGTELRSSGRDVIKSQIASAFTLNGTSYLLTYKDLLSKAVTDGQSSSWDWYDCDVEVPSDVNLTGAKHWGTGFDVGCDAIWPLEAITQEFVCNRVHCWLRSVASASYFSYLYNGGNVSNWGPASNSGLWFRPFFLIS